MPPHARSHPILPNEPIVNGREPRKGSSKTISLLERQTPLLLLPASTLLVAVVWAVDGVLGPLDRVAYPALIATWGALFALPWRWPQRLLLVQGLATVPLVAFFVLGTLLRRIEAGANPGIYRLASPPPWLMAMHLVVFVALPMRPARARRRLRCWPNGDSTSC